MKHIEIEDVPVLELTLAQWRRIAMDANNNRLQSFLNHLEGMDEKDSFALVPARADWLLHMVNQLNN